MSSRGTATTITDNVADTVASWGLGLTIAIIGIALLVLVASIAIAKKAGYSGWWGALFALVWPISWLVMGIFAVLKWPVVKERNEAIALLKENGLELASHTRRAAKEEKKAKKDADAQAAKAVTAPAESTEV